MGTAFDAVRGVSEESVGLRLVGREACPWTVPVKDSE